MQDLILQAETRKLVLNNPFINQCFYVAASTWASGKSSPTVETLVARPFRLKLLSLLFSKDLRSQRLKEDGRVRVGRTLLSSSALNSFNVCAKVLREQARIWLGVGWIAAALGQSLRKDRVLLPANIRLKPDVVTA